MEFMSITRLFYITDMTIMNKINKSIQFDQFVLRSLIFLNTFSSLIYHTATYPIMWYIYRSPPTILRDHKKFPLDVKEKIVTQLFEPMKEPMKATKLCT